MIKKIKIELLIICFLILNIYISSYTDINLYNKFNNFDFSLGNIYLKQFFVNITEVGNSLWIFLLSFLTYLICFLINKINQNGLLKKLKTTSLFVFSATLITGMLTQILKHLVGRPRPNHAVEFESIGISFFNLDSAFHSFPSGHTSTIFITALAFSVFTPKIKYFYLFFALIVGLSRVVVGAHYISDVIGGIAIAYIGFKITLLIFNKFESQKINIKNIEFDINVFFLNLIVFIIIIIFLAVGHSLDIYISELFYEGNQVFNLQSFSYLTILARDIFLPLIIIYILVLPIVGLYFPINKIYFGINFNLRQILFLWGSLVFNIIIVINLTLKNFWGRARPNDILQLGGKENFSPWFAFSDSCNTNCSFVSGDASVGFSIIALFFLTNNKKFYWFALFSGLFLGGIRILEGAHFLSDIIIAGFLIFILTYIQSIFYKKQTNNVI